jgi:hypothetical protein
MEKIELNVWYKQPFRTKTGSIVKGFSVVELNGEVVPQEQYGFILNSLTNGTIILHINKNGGGSIFALLKMKVMGEHHLLKINPQTGVGEYGAYYTMESKSERLTDSIILRLQEQVKESIVLLGEDAPLKHDLQGSLYADERVLNMKLKFYTVADLKDAHYLSKDSPKRSEIDILLMELSNGTIDVENSSKLSVPKFRKVLFKDNNINIVLPYKYAGKEQECKKIKVNTAIINDKLFVIIDSTIPISDCCLYTTITMLERFFAEYVNVRSLDRYVQTAHFTQLDVADKNSRFKKNLIAEHTYIEHLKDFYISKDLCWYLWLYKPE